MMAKTSKDKAKMISIDQIRVVNPRDRNAQRFQEVVDSISRVGLKRPIIVSRVAGNDRKKQFDLVCGQGRLEAFTILEQTEIPAFIIEASEEDCFLMSLVENLARRQHSSQELMHDIGALSDRGYSTTQIGKKTGLTREYVNDVLQLMKKGEGRMIAAVERNQIPITVAMDIVNCEGDDVQRALTDAYERGELRGHRLQTAMRVVQARQRNGKSLEKSNPGPRQRKASARSMVRVYKQETDRQRAMIMRSDITERRLLFIVSALKELFSDENFVTLLRAEELNSVPRQIADLFQD
jgi:ParB family chromosome partitioning protein|tara:strand:+ start:2221 stop:3105 length:885 start_codon:yes stop_codon:yes gene_type:complete